MKNCPYCNKPLRKYSYSGYWEPPESGEECNNKKCGKYAEKYDYYDGATYICGNWRYNEENSIVNIESAELELKMRIKYQLKRMRGKK